MCLDDLMSKDEIRRSWALPSFLDANSVERVAIEFLCSNVKRYPKDYFRTNISHQEYLFKKSYAIGLTWWFSFLAKVGCMALTFRIHGTRSRVASLSIVLLKCLCPSFLGFGTLEGIVSRIPGWRLELAMVV